MLKIYVDADACPVKQEVYRVAKRFGLPVTLVANSPMRVPQEDWIKFVIVDDSSDAADDWIVEQVEEKDIVITTDIPLASRALKKEARVLAPTGKEFHANNIGDSLASRELLSRLRGWGDFEGGPPPFTQRNRSYFLQQLDEVIKQIQRETKS